HQSRGQQALRLLEKPDQDARTAAAGGGQPLELETVGRHHRHLGSREEGLDQKADRGHDERSRHDARPPFCPFSGAGGGRVFGSGVSSAFSRGPVTWSFSSTISPNSSARRSSIVTRPTVRPYSSTTSARWVLRRCIWRNSRSSLVVLGT